MIMWIFESICHRAGCTTSNGWKTRRVKGAPQTELSRRTSSREWSLIMSIEHQKETRGSIFYYINLNKIYIQCITFSYINKNFENYSKVKKSVVKKKHQ